MYNFRIKLGKAYMVYLCSVTSSFKQIILFIFTYGPMLNYVMQWQPSWNSDE